MHSHEVVCCYIKTVLASVIFFFVLMVSGLTYLDALLVFSKMLARVVSVEYALRDDDERDDIRGSCGRRGSRPYGWSLSPGYRRRPSHEYGRARSPGYDRYSGLPYGSPVCDRNRTSEYGRYHR